jgi:hypothetical protein
LLAVQNALQVLAGERCPHTVNPAVYEVRERKTASFGGLR